MQFFGSLQLLMALLGSSWSVLGGFGSRMGFPKFSKMLSTVCQKMIKKWPIWVPKKGFKISLNRDRRAKAFSTIDCVFSYVFFQFFFRFWSSLGASWEPSWASWGSLGRPLDPKTFKNFKFFKVFENAAFWLFEAPDGPLCSSWLLLVQIWSQDGVPKWVSKVPRKGIKKEFYMFVKK